MKYYYFFLFLLILNTSSLSAQFSKGVNEKNFDKAEEIFSKIYQNGKGESLTDSKSGYASAIPIYLNLYTIDPENMNLAFKLGVCYSCSRSERHEAISYFNRSISSTSKHYKGSSFSEKNAPIIAYKFLGDAYHLDYQFDKAIVAYEKFIATMNANKITDEMGLSEARRKIKMCETGKILVANPIKLNIQNLGGDINSPYGDYSPVLSADQKTLLFTSRRPETTGGQKDGDGNDMEDIYMSTKTESGWSKAVGVGSRINTEWHEATVGISPDGQTILIYKDDKGDGNIYSASLDGDVWGTPVKLNENINTKYWEPSAFISADGATMYFTSDKPDGYGGRDLYISKRTFEGDWGKAINMGPNINTIYDEDAPFIHPNGVTLSFSSNGHSTMGGFDIFNSLLSEDGLWSEPVNVGHPINTTYDDIFYMVSPDSRKAYFSSFREDGLGEKDNYVVTFLDRKETPLTLMKGIVNDESGKPAKKVEIIVTDNETGNIAGVYHTNSKTGQFLFILTPGKNYNITYQAKDHLFYSENMEIPIKSNYYEFNRSVSLDPIIVGSMITLNNIFFDFDKSTLRTVSNVELKNLAQLLKSNPNLKVEISGHTDSKGDDVYNQKLSEERAQAVVLSLTKQGINEGRMKAKGYGKKKPVADNRSENGNDNPEGRQLNRRVEFTITEIN